MTDITVYIELADGSLSDYSLDPETSIANFRNTLKEDDLLEGDEIFVITETNTKIPKSQEEKKTFKSLAKDDKTVRLSLFRKTQPEQKPEEAKFEASERLPLSCPDKRPEEDLARSPSRELSQGGYVDVMDLSEDAIKNILNKCSYLYGRKVDSDLRVTEAAKKFFADIPENRQFEQSNRSSQNHLGEKFIRISRKEEQEALIKGYSEGNVKVSIKVIADVQGKLRKEKNKHTTESKQGEYIYAESVYSSATFKLREIRSVVSDDVKNFFKPGEVMSTEKMYEFLDTFGALVPESITVGGKRYTTIEAKSSEFKDSTTQIDDKNLQADLKIKMFGAGGGYAGQTHSEDNISKFSRQDSFSMQCFGGNPEFKDQPEEWTKSVCRSWSSWQIVSIQDFRYTYEYLDEPFRTWFKRLFEPDSVEHLKYSDGSSYEGQTIGKKREGKGKLTYANGDVYEGQFRDDKEDGPGKLTKKDGTEMEATWIDGVVGNWMRLTRTDGLIYDGSMKEFKLDGKGIWTYPNDDVLSATYKDGKYHGLAVYTRASGPVVEVLYKDDVGPKGKITYPYGVYEGDIEDFIAQGDGVLKSYTGDVYEGEFADDKMNGTGKYTFQHGAVYEGDFQDGLMYGTGTYDASNGQPLNNMIYYNGEWAEGTVNGQGTGTDIYGYMYTGSFSNGLYHGYGVYCALQDRIPMGPLDIFKYEGQFIQGFREGHGGMTFANGFFYQGEFQQDWPKGKGKLYWKPGQGEEGKWDMEKIGRRLNK